MSIFKRGSNQYVKKTKIIHNGKVIKEFNCDGRKESTYKKLKTGKTWFQSAVEWVVKWTKISAAVLLVTGVISGSYHFGGYMTKPVTVEADIQVPTPVMPDVPVLDRIADCESGARNSKGGPVIDSSTQFNKKTGQVQLNANTNHTVDIGKYMINETVWGSTATSMGDDLTTEEGNTKFAQWLFMNKGTSAWNDSQSCWSK